MRSLKELKQDILSDDWKTALAASDALAQIGGKAALDILLPLLSSPASWTRNAAALGLRDIGDNAAVEPLVHAISALGPQDDRGTLVYALQSLDCSRQFRFLFDLTLCDVFELQNHALAILKEQEFQYAQADITEAQDKLDIYGRRKDRPAGTDLLIRDLQVLLDHLRTEDSDTLQQCPA